MAHWWNASRWVLVGGGTKVDHSQFSIGDTSFHSAGSVAVDVYSTKRTVFVDQDSSSCFASVDPNSTCDWDEMFKSANVSFFFLDDSLSQNIIEYNLPRLGGPNLTAWCSYYAYVANADYTLDPSPATNYLSFVDVNIGLNISSGPVYVHPDWVLAAWSVARSGVVDADREVAINLVSALKSQFDSSQSENSRLNNTDYLPEFNLQNMFIFAQALSMVDFTTINTTEIKIANSDPDHPIFPAHVSLRVWAYGIESRTSKLGVAVALFGCLCVFFRSVLHIITRTEQRTTLEVIAAALECDNEGEFEGMESETEIAKVKFRISATDEGKMKFVPL